MKIRLRTFSLLILLTILAGGLMAVYSYYNVGFAREVDSAIQSGLLRDRFPLEITSDDKAFLLETARAVLENHFSGNKQDLDFSVPSSLSGPSQRLYVTLITNGKIRACMGAQEDNYAASMLEALYRAISDKRFGGPMRAEEVKDTVIDITIMFSPQKLKGHSLAELKRQFEPGVHAISMAKGARRAFFKSSVPISHNYTLKSTLVRLGRKARIGRNAYKDKAVDIHRYKTVQFAEDGPGGGVLDIYRNNRIVMQSQVSERVIEEAARMAAEYLAAHTAPDGQMTYDYSPYSDTRQMGGGPIVRNVASVWALAAAGSRMEDAGMTAAAKRGAEYFIKKHFVYDEDKDIGYLKFGDDASIAAPAFLLMALTEIDDKTFYPRAYEAMIKFMLAAEDKEKGFLYPMYLPDKLYKFDKKEVYYAGEALTCFMVLHEKTKDERFLGVCERVFDYYTRLFENSRKRASMVPWMSRAYSGVYFATGDKKYADFVFKMNDYILDECLRGTDERYPDKIGAFSSNGSYCAAGVYVEGLTEAYKTAKAVGDKERMKKYRKAILMGNRFLLQGQYTDKNMFTARNRALTKGGIRTSVYNSSIRIDAVQHGLFGFLKTRILFQ